MRADSVHVARVYETRRAGDGVRVLVDRLWPRGLARSVAELDEWCRDVAPSTDLRRWYGHEPARFAEFTQRYRKELAEPGPAAALATLVDHARGPGLTLLTASTAVDISQAAVLADVVRAAVAAP